MKHLAHPRRLARLSRILTLALATAVSTHAIPGNSSPGECSPTNGPGFGREAIDAYLDAARARTLAACTAKGLTLPPDFLAWIDGDPIVRESVYGCRNNPLPVLLGLRSLEIDLGETIVRRDYTQLALAFAIQGTYAAPSRKASGWNDGDGAPPAEALPDISPRQPLELVIPGDPRVRVDTKDSQRVLDRDDHIVNFLEDHEPIEVEVTTTEVPPLEYDDKGVAKPRGKAVKVQQKIRRALVGADVIASVELQAEFNEYMHKHGHPEITLDCGNKVVDWNSKEAVSDKELRQRIATAHELFHTAYRNKGRMPAERDAAPTASESMAWFVRNDRFPFSDADRIARKWPRFPLQAPWPVLMMLAADDQPLREREDIWTKFRDTGEFRTYGEYIGGIAQQFDMQSARRVSPIAYSYGSIQMMWKDGGVCGTMGNIGARTYRICGVPSSTAGQPGHCAIVLMEHDEKTGYRCKGGQYATGGDEVTTVHAGWNYDDVGGRKPMVYHQSIAWGVNHGLSSFLDALVLRRIWDAMPADQRASQCLELATTTLALNPFALPALEGAIAATPDSATAIKLLDLFEQRLQPLGKPGEYALYRATVRDVVHQHVLDLPAPKTSEATKELLHELERQACANPSLLARCWRDLGGEDAFTKGSVAAAQQYLASPGRTKDKHESAQFAKWIGPWARSVKGPARKKAWANAMLEVFAGKEALQIRKKVTLDPVVQELCKVAGREVPQVGK
jgi:hypothetical protein